MKNSKCMMKTAALALLCALALAGCSGGKPQGTKGVERITATNGAFAAYKFTIPKGENFGTYTKITAQFLVDRENYKSTARARVLGAYQPGDFDQSGESALVNYGSGETDKNGPYIACNLFGSDTPFDILSAEAGANTWFTMEFPLTGKRHNAYKEANYPDNSASGDVYFCVGLSKASMNGITYYAKDVKLSNDDGSKTVVSKGSGFKKPAFVGYDDPNAAPVARAIPSVIGDSSAKEEEGPVAITIDTNSKHQHVIGFGGMATAWVSPVLTVEDIDACYGPGGLGYTILRIILYDDRTKWDDIVPVAKKAQGYGATILACPWTPPPALKSSAGNEKPNVGGHLLPENYGKYAEHLRDYVRYMKSKGVTINVISLQNEPDIEVSYDSCEWSAEEMIAFVTQYGRTIGDTVKILPGESFQYKRNFTDPLLNNAEALQNFDIIGGHIYGGGLEPYPLVRAKGKEYWMTEHLLNTPSYFAYDPTWPAALLFAEELHNCMLADFEVYLWWYIKRYYSLIGDGEYNTASGQTLPRGYVLSHYAKYATGKDRIEAKAAGNGNVLVSAYESADELSFVVINLGKSASEATIALPGAVQGASGVESSAAGNMRNKSVSLGSDGKTATLTLEPKSIVSLTFTK